MRIKAFPFVPSDRMFPEQVIAGKVHVPKSAKIVHVGAAPPHGEMFLYCEVPDVKTPKVELNFVIMKEDQPIPDRYVYRGYILAVPILFVYQLDESAIITP